jgi:hypothetical protein
MKRKGIDREMLNDPSEYFINAIADINKDNSEYHHDQRAFPRYLID